MFTGNCLRNKNRITFVTLVKANKFYRRCQKPCAAIIEIVNRILHEGMGRVLFKVDSSKKADMVSATFVSMAYIIFFIEYFHVRMQISGDFTRNLDCCFSWDNPFLHQLMKLIKVILSSISLDSCNNP